LDKYKLHIQEIEKIISLVMSLMYRLMPIESSLNNIEWNGVEERYELERRKEKLVSQLEEAKILWKSINKRTGLIAIYIKQTLFNQDVVDFHHCIVRRVEQMIQLKELQEQIKQAETQLKTVRRVKKDLKYLKYF